MFLNCFYISLKNYYEKYKPASIKALLIGTREEVPTFCSFPMLFRRFFLLLILLAGLTTMESKEGLPTEESHVFDLGRNMYIKYTSFT